MNKESYSCKECFLKKRCPSPLQPERIRSTGYISKGALAPVREACRHTTCDEGFEAAREAMRIGGENMNVMNQKGDVSSVIRGATFGTIDKPTQKNRLRIVDIDTGEIYSWQDGFYYPTSQCATQWY